MKEKEALTLIPHCPGRKEAALWAILYLEVGGPGDRTPG